MKNLMLLLILLSKVSSVTFGQKNSAIKINGSIWNEETGLDIDCKIYGFINQKRIFLGSTNSFKQFDFYLPTNLDSLEFIPFEFSNVILSTNFFGSFVKKSNVNISIKTKKEKSINLNNNSIYFCNPEKIEFDYIVKHYVKDTVHCTNKITKGLSINKGLRWESTVREKPTNYGITCISEDEKVLLENKFLSFRGLNFVDLNIYSTSKDSFPFKDTLNVISNYPNVIKDNWTIFFQQSKYEIDSLNVQSLNALLQTLKFSKFQKIIISGYTDGVGNENLNQILGDYRSQTVAKYLSSHGIEQSRLAIVRSDKYRLQSLQKNKNNIKEYRKVEIKIIL